MRYRGGGVGHLYMRAIEVWLTETGWGADNALFSDSDSEDSGHEDPGGGHTDNGDGHSEDEASSEGDTSSNGTDHSSSDTDPDTLYATDEDKEETLDGEYGFSGF